MKNKKIFITLGAILTGIFGVFIAADTHAVANDAFDDDAFYACAVWSYYNNNATVAEQNSIGWDEIKGDYLALAEVPLTDEQLLKVTRLNCTNTATRSAKGIGKMKNLTSVTITGGKLTEIDLSALTEVQDLFLSHNSLTALDLSKNAELEQLYVNDNKLTALDVSKNLKLYSLEMPDNDITEIDVSKNENLRYLSADDIMVQSGIVAKNNGDKTYTANLSGSKYLNPVMAEIVENDALYTLNSNINTYNSITIINPTAFPGYVQTRDFSSHLSNLAFKVSIELEKDDPTVLVPDTPSNSGTNTDNNTTPATPNTSADGADQTPAQPQTVATATDNNSVAPQNPTTTTTTTTTSSEDSSLKAPNTGVGANVGAIIATVSVVLVGGSAAILYGTKYLKSRHAEQVSFTTGDNIEKEIDRILK